MVVAVSLAMYYKEEESAAVLLAHISDGCDGGVADGLGCLRGRLPGLLDSLGLVHDLASLGLLSRTRGRTRQGSRKRNGQVVPTSHDRY